MTDYRSLLRIPVDGSDAILTTRNGEDFSRGYERVVFSRGPWVELSRERLMCRLVRVSCDFTRIELRTKDYVRVYDQLKPRDGLRPGMLYVSAYDVFCGGVPVIGARAQLGLWREGA